MSDFVSVCWSVKPFFSMMFSKFCYTCMQYRSSETFFWNRLVGKILSRSELPISPGAIENLYQKSGYQNFCSFNLFFQFTATLSVDIIYSSQADIFNSFDKWGFQGSRVGFCSPICGTWVLWIFCSRLLQKRKFSSIWLVKYTLKCTLL